MIGLGDMVGSHQGAAQHQLSQPDLLEMILECVCQLERLWSLFQLEMLDHLSHTLPEMLGCLSQPDMLEFRF